MTTFDCVGVPAPKGSIRAFMPRGHRFPVLTSDNKGLKAWAAIVRASAIIAQVSKLETGPVSVGLAFRLVRPDDLRRKSTLTTQPPHVKKPDLDKLVRGVLDAISGVGWHDDSQVDSLRVTKRYTRPQEEPGVTVFIVPTPHGEDA